jgi:hypothetical protein
VHEKQEVPCGFHCQKEGCPQTSRRSNCSVEEAQGCLCALHEEHQVQSQIHCSTQSCSQSQVRQVHEKQEV